MLQLVVRNLTKHPVRTLLTMGSLTVALFLICFLRSLVTTLEAGVEAADSRRLWVQSAVSLFVDLPASYETKIRDVEGVRDVCRWQWFGGYYKERANFFAQFAVNPDMLFDMWPEMEIIDGSKQQFLATKTGCLIGEGLAERYGWKVGDTVPIIGALFPLPGGAPWEFVVGGIYRPKKPSLDRQTLFFQWDYFSETQEALTGEPPAVGVYVLEADAGADVTQVMAGVDRLFENGPQRVQTTTEAEFNRQFVSMVGNVPRLVMFIGTGVFLAILLACINTMMLAAREQTHDIGILKALGFTDRTMFSLLLTQSLVLCGIGGGAGILLALGLEGWFNNALAASTGGFIIKGETIAWAVVAMLAVGLLSGIVPARRAQGLNTVDALRRS
ncbi:MAG: FtsX-like permease family protein [Planctomycetota bacterium]